MIFRKWTKDLLEVKLFRSKHMRDTFLIRCAIAKSEHYVSWVQGLKQGYVDQDEGEIERRRRYLQREGFNAPTSEKDCDLFIKELRQWREM